MQDGLESHGVSILDYERLFFIMVDIVISLVHVNIVSYHLVGPSST